MSKSKSLFKTCLIGSAIMAFTTGTFATDSDRITQLEKELRNLQLRLSNLESSKNSLSKSQPSAVTNENWKNLTIWRSLKIGITPDEVRTILGEPTRVEGGARAYWYYPRSGNLEFEDGKLRNWSEPRFNN